MATEINLINTDIVAKSITSANTVAASEIRGNGRLLKNILATPEVIYMKTFLNYVQDVSLETGAFTEYPVFPDTAGYTLNQGGFFSDFNSVVVPETGIYIVGACARYNIPSRDNHSTIQVAPTINGIVQKDAGRDGYMQGFSSHLNSSSNFSSVFSLETGDVISLKFKQIALIQPWQEGDTSLLSSSYFFMYRIR